MGKIRFPSLLPLLWESKAIGSLKEMWNVMTPTLDFLGKLFYLLWAPCHCCSGGESPSIHCGEMRFPCFLAPFRKVELMKEFGLGAAGTDVQVPTTHGVFLGAIVSSLHWHEVLVCGLLLLSSLSSSLFSGKSSCSDSAEWEVPAGFCTATLSFMSTSDISLYVNLILQRSLFNR